MRQVIFDVETKKTFEEVGGYLPEKLQISFVGVCVRERIGEPGELLGFFENELESLFPLLQTADVIVGFNSDEFDVPTLRPYYPGEVRELPSLDLMKRIKESVGYRIGLDAVAQSTLGVGKSGDGLDAITYYQTGQLDKLKEYCLKDVALTRDIYDAGLRTGKVSFLNKWNRKVEALVDFSFSPRANRGVQLSLL